jgi:hypothetical protein
MSVGAGMFVVKPRDCAIANVPELATQVRAQCLLLFVHVSVDVSRLLHGPEVSERTSRSSTRRRRCRVILGKRWALAIKV